MVNFLVKAFKLRKTNWFSAYFFILVIVSLSACKESDTLGGDLLPVSDRSPFSASSKFTFSAHALKEDSIKTDEVSYNLLGSYVDPVFGKSSASFITQFVSTTSQVDFGTNPQADSMVLSLTYQGYYGSINKLNGLQKIRIYRATSSPLKDSSYYSARNPMAFYQESDFISEHSFLPDPTGKFQSGTPVQKFKLPNSLAQNLLDNQSTINSGGLPNFFKGLYFKDANSFQTSGNGAILSFNLINTSAQSKVTIYFHNDASSQQVYELFITSDCARVNFFNHQHNGITALTNQFTDTTAGKEQLFVQNMAGVSSKIWFTNLDAWKDSMPLAIAKAELVIPVDQAYLGGYEPQSRLLLVEKSSTGVYTSIYDFELGDNYFNGQYNSTTKSYSFNLGSYIQDIIAGKIKQKGLYILPTASAVGANRVVLKGTNYMKLNVTYSKIKQ